MTLQNFMDIETAIIKAIKEARKRGNFRHARNHIYVLREFRKNVIAEYSKVVANE